MQTVFVRQGTRAASLENIAQEAEARELRAISAEQFIVNLLSLCIFLFIARPLLETLFDMDEAAFERFIEERKEQIPRLGGLRW